MRFKPMIAIGAATASIAAALQAQDLPVIDLGYTLQQATLNNTGTYGLFNFSNIRFGEPPTSTLRFAAPIPPQTTNRTINNGQQGVICPQASPTWLATALYVIRGQTPPNTSIVSPSSSEIIDRIPPPAVGTSEDCLFLDVIVPEKIYNSKFAKAQRRGDDYGNSTGAPVLVWLYGGGYVTGDKEASGNPSTLISRSLDAHQEGVVYVAPNYRLGAFGWQASKAFKAQGGSPNAGLLDQRLALEWVQQYIHLFGGDASRVTVMGESAGGGSILHHITAPSNNKTTPLFARGIAQSPAFQPVVSGQETETFEATLKYASLLSNSTVTTLAQLRALPFEVLYKVNALQVAVSPYGTFTFGPVIDKPYVPDLPGRRLLEGFYPHNLKVIPAHNQNEGTLFTSLANQNDSTFLALVESLIPYAPAHAVSHVANALYPPVFDGSYPWTTQLARARQLTEEFTIVCNTYFLARALAPARAWKYQFSVPPSVHADDIAYTFYNGDETTPDVGGGTVNATVAGVLQAWIVDFAARGSPRERGGAGVRFPDYGDGAGRVLDLNSTSALGTVLADANDNPRCRYWQEASWKRA